MSKRSDQRSDAARYGPPPTLAEQVAALPDPVLAHVLKTQAAIATLTREVRDSNLDTGWAALELIAAGQSMIHGSTIEEERERLGPLYEVATARLFSRLMNQ